MYTEGNPIGFQRCVNIDNAIGSARKKIDEKPVLLKSLRPIRFRWKSVQFYRHIYLPKFIRKDLSRLLNNEIS
jgi:hypothetical protein